MTLGLGASRDPDKSKYPPPKNKESAEAARLAVIKACRDGCDRRIIETPPPNTT